MKYRKTLIVLLFIYSNCILIDLNRKNCIATNNSNSFFLFKNRFQFKYNNSENYFSWFQSPLKYFTTFGLFEKQNNNNKKTISVLNKMYFDLRKPTTRPIRNF